MEDVIDFIYEKSHSIIIICLTIAFAFFLMWVFFSRVIMQGFSMSPKINDRDIVLIDRLYKSFLPLNRYDVVVFNLNGQENIKRIIGLPNDRIRISSGNVYINNEKADTDYVFNSVPSDFEQELIVDKNQYYVLGDNLYSSKDSRSTDIGTIKKNMIIGKVWYVIGAK